MAFLAGTLASHGRNIVRDGLIFHVDASLSQSYPGTGTTWNDISATANNASLINGPTFSSTNGGTIVFDGSNDYVVSASNTGITTTATRTLCAWFYPTTTPSNTTIIRIGAGSTSQLYELQFDASYITGHFWGSGWALSSLHGKTLVNTWSYFVMAYNGTTVSQYVDGEFKGSGNFALGTANSQVAIGIKAYSPHYNFAGRVSTASLYNKALTADEIKQNYYAGLKVLSA